MRSLFSVSDNEAIIKRINQLTIHSTPLWGKMNVQQMLAHCQQPLNVAFGELKIKRGLAGILFGSWAKKKMAGDLPFQKNLPTEKKFIITEYSSMVEEKNKLIALISQFAERGPAGLSQEPHPFFGKLKTDEWDILSWKHLDHHLRQFGA